MATFYRMLRFLLPYRRSCALSFVLAGLAMLVTAAIPWLTGVGIDDIQNHDKHRLLWLSLGIIGLAVVRFAFSAGRRLVAGYVSLGVEYDIRQKIFNRLQGLELDYFETTHTGELMSRSTVDLQSVRFFLGYGLIFIVQSILTISIAALALIAKDWILGICALAPMPLMVYSSNRYGKEARPAQQVVAQRTADLTSEAEENVVGVRLVKSFAAQEPQQAKFRAVADRLYRQEMFAAKLQAIYNPILAFIPSISQVVVLGIGGLRVIHGDLSIGDFVAAFAYVTMLAGPLRQLGVALAMGQRSVAAGNRIYEIIDREPTIVDSPDAIEIDAIASIRFDGASLRFSNGSLVVDDLSLTIEPGQVVGIVGPTASGKSTALKLVPRLWDTTSGTVLMDDNDIRQLELTALRSKIAIAEEDPFLFSTSVKTNLTYGRPEADDSEVMRAASIARAESFVSALPSGYETMIGERGLSLSAGQRQRLGIARALVAKPSVLILDDATSALDATTERELATELQQLGRNSQTTTLLVTNRARTLANTDTVVLIEKGSVSDQGSHAELLKRNELYRQLVNPDPKSHMRDEEW